jgi:hypothetical protein
MKKRSFHPVNTLFLFYFLILLSACAVGSLVIKINTSQDQNARFDQYHTYNWYPAAAASPSSEGQTDYGMLQAHVKKAIEQEIAKKGLQKETENPQLFLAYDVSLPKPTAPPAQAYPPGFGYGLAWHMGLRYDYGHAKLTNYQPVNTFAPGTILIDVIDANTRELIWRGWAEEVIEDFNADYKTITNYVDDIIDKYPSKTSSNP